MVHVYFYQIFLSTDDVIFKLYIILCQNQNALSLLGAL